MHARAPAMFVLIQQQVAPCLGNDATLRPSLRSLPLRSRSGRLHPRPHYLQRFARRHVFDLCFLRQFARELRVCHLRVAVVGEPHHFPSTAARTCRRFSPRRKWRERLPSRSRRLPRAAKKAHAWARARSCGMRQRRRSRLLRWPPRLVALRRGSLHLDQLRPVRLGQHVTAQGGRVHSHSIALQFTRELRIEFNGAHPIPHVELPRQRQHNLARGSRDGLRLFHGAWPALRKLTQAP